MRVATNEPAQRNTDLFDSLAQLLKKRPRRWIEVGPDECIGSSRRAMLRQAMNRRGLNVETNEDYTSHKILIRARG